MLRIHTNSIKYIKYIITVMQPKMLVQSHRVAPENKQLPNDQKIVLNRIKACQ